MQLGGDLSYENPRGLEAGETVIWRTIMPCKLPNGRPGFEERWVKCVILRLDGAHAVVATEEIGERRALLRALRRETEDLQ